MSAVVDRTTLLITMAGAGSRFAAAGYTVPKYEIAAHGRTLFEWSMESLRGFIDRGCEFCFLVRPQANVESFIAAGARALGVRRYQVVKVERLTDGQATTAMLAGFHLRNWGSPIGIYNIDTYVEPGAIQPDDVSGNGWIPCFEAEGEAWSFAAADGDGRVTEVREKRRISSHATVGFYWFDSFRRFARAYERYYADQQRLEAKERYVAPLYNQLIRGGAAVFLRQLDARLVHPLGTPEEVRMFNLQPFGGKVLTSAQ